MHKNVRKGEEQSASAYYFFLFRLQCKFCKLSLVYCFFAVGVTGAATYKMCGNSRPGCCCVSVDGCCLVEPARNVAFAITTINMGFTTCWSIIAPFQWLRYTLRASTRIGNQSMVIWCTLRTQATTMLSGSSCRVPA